jgi:predicted heme/steroid binding protein
MDEVAKHVSRDDAWLVLFGEAIDVTQFLPLHPGGEDMITAYLGKDATADWQEIHRPEHLDKHMQHLRKIGRIKTAGGLLSWLLGGIAKPEGAQTAFPTQNASVQAADADSDPQNAAEESEVEPVRWTAEHEAELPPGGVFDLQELSRWDGVQLPMCIGVCGFVVDVSSSGNFVPNFGYGKLWAGKDTTWAMATVSLKAHDANKFDFQLDDLEELQLKSLAGWYKHFTSKYRTVGTLKELKNWNFSSVEKAAADLPVPSFQSTQEETTQGNE